jgi:hypothetical protein
MSQPANTVTLTSGHTVVLLATLPDGRIKVKSATLEVTFETAASRLPQAHP